MCGALLHPAQQRDAAALGAEVDGYQGALVVWETTAELYETGR